MGSTGTAHLQDAPDGQRAANVQLARQVACNNGRHSLASIKTIRKESPQRHNSPCWLTMVGSTGTAHLQEAKDLKHNNQRRLQHDLTGVGSTVTIHLQGAQDMLENALVRTAVPEASD